MKKVLLFSFIFLIVCSPGFSLASAIEYRTIDGYGNNEANKNLGTPNQQLTRIAPVGYDLGISIPRGGNPSILPSAREISNVVVAQSGSIPNPQGASDMLWQWGQLIDHDLDLTLPQSGPTAETFDIPIPYGDPIFDQGKTGNQIMPFKRSTFDTTTGTSPSNPREQTNVVTAFIDGSMVYGSDSGRESFIRDLAANNGKLKLFGGLLPLNDAIPPLPNGNGPPGNDPADMFVAGDVRVNEQVGLTVIHTLLAREHNWLVDKLIESGEVAADNEEELYQQAKVILEGEIQHITYHEFLPMLLGSEMLDEWVAYDDTVDPQVSTEFSTGGFRVGHTLLSSTLERFNEDGTIPAGGHLSLAGSFFNPDIVKNDGIEPVLRGLAVGKSEKIDNFVIDEVRNFLFGEPAPIGGFDLAALNIQRGRDHGIPSYNDVRYAYGLQRVNSFFDITQDEILADKLKSVYGINADGSDNVNAVDLWVGGISEPPVPGGMVGKTFAAILRDEFERVRDGDRFWYENRALSPFQIDMIENTLLSDIILRNTEIDSIQKNVFLAMDRVVPDLDGDGIPDATDPDDDGDGIYDTVDTMPRVFSNSFSDGATTFGNIESRGGQTLTVSDLTDPAGIQVSATGGGAPARVSTCGFDGTISFDSGDSADITCGSVIIKVISGPVDITYTMDESTMEIKLDTDGSITVDFDSLTITNNSNFPIIIEIDGEQITIGPNETFEIHAPQDHSQIGGEIIPLDATSLLIAGVQSSVFWILPVVLVSVGLVAIKKIRSKISLKY